MGPCARSTGEQVAGLLSIGAVLVVLVPLLLLLGGQKVGELLGLHFPEMAVFTCILGGVLAAAGLAFGLSTVILQLTRRRERHCR